MFNPISSILGTSSHLFSQESSPWLRSIQSCFTAFHTVHAAYRLGSSSSHLWTGWNLACGSILYGASRNFLSLRVVAQIILIARRITHVMRSQHATTHQYKMLYHSILGSYNKPIAWISTLCSSATQQISWYIRSSPSFLLHIILRIASIFFHVYQFLQSCFILSNAYLELFESLTFNSITQWESSLHFSTHLKTILSELIQYKEQLFQEVDQAKPLFDAILKGMGWNIKAQSLSDFIKKSIDTANRVEQSVNRVLSFTKDSAQSLLYSACYVTSGLAPDNLLPTRHVPWTPEYKTQVSYARNDCPYSACQAQYAPSNGRFFSPFK